MCITSSSTAKHDFRDVTFGFRVPLQENFGPAANLDSLYEFQNLCQQFEENLEDSVYHFGSLKGKWLNVFKEVVKVNQVKNNKPTSAGNLLNVNREPRKRTLRT